VYAVCAQQMGLAWLAVLEASAPLVLGVRGGTSQDIAADTDDGACLQSKIWTSCGAEHASATMFDLYTQKSLELELRRCGAPRDVDVDCQKCNRERAITLTEH
jgi:hypothetical protein